MTPSHTHTDAPDGSEAVALPQYDSTDSSEDEELDMPPVATGNDLMFMKRVLEVAHKSGDTKVSTMYHAGF